MTSAPPVACEIVETLKVNYNINDSTLQAVLPHHTSITPHSATPRNRWGTFRPKKRGTRRRAVCRAFISLTSERAPVCMCDCRSPYSASAFAPGHCAAMCAHPPRSSHASLCPCLNPLFSLPAFFCILTTYFSEKGPPLA